MSRFNTIAVFGGTGTLGLLVLDQAVKSGLKVTALVRNESGLPDDIRDKIVVVKGNVLNKEDVDKAVEGAEAVIVALGTRNQLGPTTDMSSGLENIVAAMDKYGVTVISVCLSSFLFLPSDKVPPMFTEINAEHGRMLKVLEASSAKYIAVYPPHFGDNPKGEYIVKHDTLPGGRVVAKPDLADFMITSLSQPEHYRHIVGISSVLKE